MLAAILDPLHRPAQFARQERDQQIFRIDMAFDAETAADIERDAADAGLRKFQHRGRLAPQPMHDLGRRPDRHRIGPRIVQSDHAAAFHRHGGVAMMIKAPLQPMRRARKRAVGVAFANREGADQVGAELVVDDGCARGERQFGIEHGRQRIEIEIDQLGCVFRRIAVLRHDDSHRLADVPDLIVRQQRLLRIDELVLHLRRPFARQRKLGVRHRRQKLGELRAGQRIDNAGRRGGARHIDRFYARMSDRASDKHRMQHMRQFEIGDELAAAGEETAILAPGDGTADVGDIREIVHPLPGRRISTTTGGRPIPK